MQVHGRPPAAYIRGEALARLQHWFIVALGALWVSGGVFGFWLAKWDVPLAAGACALAAGLLWLSWSRLERRLSAKEKQFVSYARGLQGELIVAALLEDLSDDWHVFHGLQLRQGQDFDHVLVGPRGLFYIQTKNWLGRLARGTGDELRHDGYAVSELASIRAQAMQLKDRLAAETGAPVRWVNAILAAPFAHVDVVGDVRNIAVVNARTLVEHIERQPEQFDRVQIDNYLAALERIARAVPEPRHAPATPAFGARSSRLSPARMPRVWSPRRY